MNNEIQEFHFANNELQELHGENAAIKMKEIMSRIGTLEEVQFVKNNFSALNIAPTTAENKTEGYTAGSVWISTGTSTNVYVCISATESTATWVSISLPVNATDDAATNPEIILDTDSNGKLTLGELDIKGDLVVGDGIGNQSVTVNGASGQNRDIVFQTNGVNRWIARANNVAESGSEDGSNFAILSRLDDGSGSDEPFQINRLHSTVGININNNGSSQLYVNQDNTGASYPVMRLRQLDESEEYIEFLGANGSGKPIQTSAIGTYYGKVRVAVNGVFKYIALYNS